MIRVPNILRGDCTIERKKRQERNAAIDPNSGITMKRFEFGFIRLPLTDPNNAAKVYVDQVIRMVKGIMEMMERINISTFP